MKGEIKIMNNRKKDDYEIPFKGCTMLSKNEGKRVWLAALFAAVGALLIAVIFGIENKPLVFLICLALSLFGYFVVEKKAIKK